MNKHNFDRERLGVDSVVENPHITLRAPSDLKAHPNNARRHSRTQIKAIAKSIDAFGFNAPILVDGDGNVLAGHGRLEAAKLLGRAQIPVIFLYHLSEAEAKAYMLADNKLTDRSSWDDTTLAVQLKELSDLVLSFDIDATGFEPPEIDLRIQSLEDIDAIDRGDNFQLAGGPSASALGNIWQLGDHRVACGSALDQATVSDLFAGEKATAAFTDPPYNVRIDGHVGGKGTIHHRDFPMATGEMSEAEFIAFLTSSLSGRTIYSIPSATGSLLVLATAKAFS